MTFDEIDRLVNNISEGIGDFKNNTNRLKKYGEQSIIRLLNAKSINNPGQRDGRDSVSDILGAIAEIAEDHRQFVIKLFEDELNKPFDKQKYVSSLSWALGHIDDRRIIPLFMKGLKHKEQWIRWECCEALLRLKSKDSIPSLIDALKDRSELVKSTAIKAMQEFGTVEAIPRLEKLLKSKRKGIRQGAHKAIELINERQKQIGVTH